MSDHRTLAVQEISLRYGTKPGTDLRRPRRIMDNLEYLDEFFRCDDD